MKKKQYIIIFISILVVVGIILGIKISSINKEKIELERNPNVPVSTMNFIMDTFVEIKLYGEQADEATKEIVQRMTDYENKMSMHIEDSEISLINKNAGVEFVKVSDSTYNLLNTAKEYSSYSEGNFDITIAPLTEMWGITSDSPRVPSDEEISRAINLIDYEDIILNEEEKSVMLRKEGQAIDLGGVAKGDSANIVIQVAKKYGIKSGYVSIGGNMVVIGDKPDGTPYHFGIRDPQGEASEYIGAVTLKNKTMATTGGYERYFEQDGKRYIHVLDPETGYPVKTDLISVSIISDNGSLADFLSTAIFMMGEEEVLKNLDNEDFDIVAVDVDNNIYMSKGMDENLTQHETKTSYNYIYYSQSVEKGN